jgi:hypothetical protein
MMAWSPQLFLVWNDPGRYVGIAVARRSFDCTQGIQNVGESLFERVIGELALTLREQRTEITPRSAIGARTKWWVRLDSFDSRSTAVPSGCACRKFRDPGEVPTATNSSVEIGGRARGATAPVSCGHRRRIERIGAH